MFSIDKIPPVLLRMNLPQIFAIYDIWALRELSENFKENILGTFILAFNCYSEQSGFNLTRTRILQPVFSGEMFGNG